MRVSRTKSLVLAATAALFSLVFVLSSPARQEDPYFGDLIGAIKKTPGCLGVDTADMESGKSVIFAWFEDKAAVLRWYYSETHQGTMKKFFPSRPPHVPLAEVADGTGPILTVASLTLVAAPNEKAGGLPVSQMSIELYTPLPGGVSFGGTFAPKGAQARTKEKATAGAR